ncbi:MAG: MaoC family dehydratase [Alphaproteobacteria bacterium]|nr:MaoC family dehydratase [Alphaproteobacteria bacterium]MBL7098843.1 MaoC family dehydratase [Alphaproteobacteria bacterium]
MSTKTVAGNFFEDFHVGQKLVHATPRTLTHGDAALYQALYGSRFALQSADSFAQACGLPHAPLDDLLVFHTVFGKTVPDVSLNAVANLGYAEGKFLKPVYAGETLSAHSEVIGLKENSNRQTGVVYVRTHGVNEKDEQVLSYVRWVMVRKRDPEAVIKESVVPSLAEAVEPHDLRVPAALNFDTLFEPSQSGSAHLWDDYTVGEKIDHVDGVTVEEAEHMMATRLYQNTARVHFNQFAEAQGRFGRRLIYGGHVISLARAISFNGLANAFTIAGINGGRHVNPLFAGDTVFAWSQVIDKQPLGHRKDVGLLRLRLVATKNLPCTAFPDRDGKGQYPAEVILDFDYWAVMPRG